MSLLVFVTFLLLALIFALVIVLNNQARLKEKAQTQQISAAGVRDLLAQGKTEEALEVYQRFTGADVFAARSAIDAMQMEIRLEDTRAELERLLRLGDKAAAIETYQQVTGATLAEALEVVETLQRQRR